MDIERAREISEQIKKRRAKSRRGAEYFRLLQTRHEVEQAFEAKIRDKGLEHLFESHEVTRKEDGKWVWINTKKKQKPAPSSTAIKAVDR